MYSKGFKTILLFLSLGFFIVWVLELRRTTLADSYWALLLVLICLLWYQFINLKIAGSSTTGKMESGKNLPGKKMKSHKTPGKGNR